MTDSAAAAATTAADVRTSLSDLLCRTDHAASLSASLPLLLDSTVSSLSLLSAVSMRRSPSAGYGFEPNKNTDWLEDRYFFVYYALLLAGFGLLFRTSDNETNKGARENANERRRNSRRQRRRRQRQIASASCGCADSALLVHCLTCSLCVCRGDAVLRASVPEQIHLDRRAHPTHTRQ